MYFSSLFKVYIENNPEETVERNVISEERCYPMVEEGSNIGFEDFTVSIENVDFLSEETVVADGNEVLVASAEKAEQFYSQKDASEEVRVRKALYAKIVNKFITKKGVMQTDEVGVENAGHSNLKQESSQEENETKSRQAGNVDSGSIKLTEGEEMKKAVTNSIGEGYTCYICRKTLTRLNYLKGHIISNHAKQCLDCFTISVETDPWSKNIKASDDRDIDCTGCGKVLTHKVKPGNQYSTKNGGGFTETESGIFVCTECGKLFARKEDVMHHQSIHKVTKDWVCHLCAKLFSSSISLDHHVKIKHDVEVEHAQSDVDDEPSDYYDEDINVTATNQSRSYEVLAKYTDAREMCAIPPKRRIDRKQNRKDQAYECSECKKVYPSRRQFQIHLRSVHKESRYGCDICKKRFKMNNQLNDHKAQQHSLQCLTCLTVNFETEPLPETATIMDTRQIICTGCGTILELSSKPGPRFKKTTQFGGAFRKTPNGYFACTECGKICCRPSKCEAHKLQHLAEKPFKCHRCAKTFTQKNFLVKHLTTLHPDDIRALSM